jgi:hypothetical protein
VGGKNNDSQNVIPQTSSISIIWEHVKKTKFSGLTLDLPSLKFWK